jgi:hypothetical protein
MISTYITRLIQEAMTRMPPTSPSGHSACPESSASSKTRSTATSYVCDRETRELGEDYPELKKIDRAFRLLERRIAAAQPRLRARRSLSTVMDFGLALADAKHDASLGSTVSLACDAFVEARVVKVFRRQG